MFDFADKLTDSDRKTFLEERGIEDKYIRHRANQSGASADFSDIQSMTDINFADKTTEFKTKSFSFGSRMEDAEKSINTIAEKFSKFFSNSTEEAL